MQYVHRVNDKESLRDICAKYGVFSADLLRDNKVSEDNVRRGLLLLINVHEGVRYVVKPFDNLNKIANKFKIKAEDIAAFNDVSEVFMGQVIYLPIV